MSIKMPVAAYAPPSGTWGWGWGMGVLEQSRLHSNPWQALRQFGGGVGVGQGVSLQVQIGDIVIFMFTNHVFQHSRQGGEGGAA